MEAAFALVVVVLAGAMFVVFLKLREANARLAAAATSGHSVEGRLDELRKELVAAKDEAARKSKALEEARSEAKKKARREGKKMQREDEMSAENADEAGSESREEVTRLKQAIAGLEQQINSLMSERDQTANAARLEAKQELEGQLAKSREEVSALQRTLDDLRESVRRKAEERPDVPGTSLDLKALPTDAVQELARYFRKAEEFERLYGVAQGRLQLAQERAQELQRRYYAVCRELALLTGGPAPASDEDARKAAESVVDKSDQAAASAGSAAAPSSSAAGQEAAPGEEGAKKKKRRRRRRKKKPGEGALAADGSEGADDEGADDGDDDEGGDDGDEPVTASASEAPATEAPAAEAPAAASEPAVSASSDDVQPASEPSSDEPRPTSDA